MKLTLDDAQKIIDQLNNCDCVFEWDMDYDYIKQRISEVEIDGQLEPPVMQKQAGTDLLKKFMKNHKCRLSYEDKWLVKDDATASWHVYQQEYGKRVKRILTTDDLQKALSLLSA